MESKEDFELFTKEQRIRVAVVNGIDKYIDELRENIDPFVDKTFSMSESWEINKKAFGKDMLRAPANALWTPLHFALTGIGAGLKKASLDKAGNTLQELPAGFSTDIEKEVEWRVYSEFLRLPYQQEERVFDGNRLLEIIIEDEALAPIFKDSLEQISELALSEDGKNHLTQNMLQYVDSRKAAAELSATLIGAATSFAATKSVNLGALGLGQAVAASATYHTAVSSFALGKTLGGVFYSVVPVSASTGAVILSTGGVAAILGVVSAFGGMLTDPLQRKLGLHQKKLNKLVDSLELQLKSSHHTDVDIKDGYAARVLDLVDFLLTISHKVK